VNIRNFESDRIVNSIIFDSIQNEHNYSKFSNTYRHHFLTYLITELESNSTTTEPETTAVLCLKNSLIYLSSSYYWWLLRPAINVWVDSNNSSTIRFKMKTRSQAVARIADRTATQQTSN